MIKFITGTPGSGKSHGMAHRIRALLRRGKNVISTVNINLDLVTRNGKLKIGKFQYIPIFELTPETLERYALTTHTKGSECQTYVFIDECQLIFNSRDYSNEHRKAWLVFFTSHRHYGFEFFLITQNDRMIDRQIRALVEHELFYKKINNRLWFIPWPIFVATEYWYGNRPKDKLRFEFIFFRPSLANMYDSYTLFDDLAEKYKNEQPAAAPDAEPAPNPELFPCTEENPNEEVGATGTEVGVGGPRPRDGGTRNSKPAFVHLREAFTSWFISPLKTAPIKTKTE